MRLKHPRKPNHSHFVVYDTFGGCTVYIYMFATLIEQQEQQKYYSEHATIWTRYKEEEKKRWSNERNRIVAYTLNYITFLSCMNDIIYLSSMYFMSLMVFLFFFLLQCCDILWKSLCIPYFSLYMAIYVHYMTI